MGAFLFDLISFSCCYTLTSHVFQEGGIRKADHLVKYPSESVTPYTVNV